MLCSPLTHSDHHTWAGSLFKLFSTSWYTYRCQSIIRIKKKKRVCRKTRAKIKNGSTSIWWMDENISLWMHLLRPIPKLLHGRTPRILNIGESWSAYEWSSSRPFGELTGIRTSTKGHETDLSVSQIVSSYHGIWLSIASRIECRAGAYGTIG